MKQAFQDPFVRRWAIKLKFRLLVGECDFVNLSRVSFYDK